MAKQICCWYSSIAGLQRKACDMASEEQIHLKSAGSLSVQHMALTEPTIRVKTHYAASALAGGFFPDKDIIASIATLPGRCKHRVQATSQASPLTAEISKRDIPELPGTGNGSAAGRKPSLLPGAPGGWASTGLEARHQPCMQGAGDSHRIPSFCPQHRLQTRYVYAEAVRDSCRTLVSLTGGWIRKPVAESPSCGPSSGADKFTSSRYSAYPKLKTLHRTRLPPHKPRMESLRPPVAVTMGTAPYTDAASLQKEKTQDPAQKRKHDLVSLECGMMP